MTELVREAIADFKRSVEITRDVRFQANLRLVKRQQASSYIVALLSLYVIALSIIPNILILKEYQNQILLGCSIILSVFVIFTSLIDGSQNFYHQGELLHQCARKIAAINHQLKNIDVDKDPDSAMEQLKDWEKQYQNALDECPTNHGNVDFYGEVARKPHLFPKKYPWKIQFFHRSGFRLLVLILEWNWIILPVLSAFIITIVVYIYVISNSTLKAG